jgi:hypothetical protein
MGNPFPQGFAGSNPARSTFSPKSKVFFDLSLKLENFWRYFSELLVPRASKSRLFAL